MKKSIKLLILIAALIIAALSLLSCEAEGAVNDYLYKVENESHPYFIYDEQADTTEVILNVRLANSGQHGIKRFTFSADFYDESGKLIDERMCLFDKEVGRGECKSMLFRFSGKGEGEDLSALRGKVSSVSYRVTERPVFSVDESVNSNGSMRWGAYDILFAALIALAFVLSCFEAKYYGDDVISAVSAGILAVISLVLLFVYPVFLAAYV
ncbi:MAG: hypothetical protein IJY18_01260 [Clostridia bacterium]|nr:hypothetical protein [Clostridia bacterium]